MGGERGRASVPLFSVRVTTSDKNSSAGGAAGPGDGVRADPGEPSGGATRAASGGGVGVSADEMVSAAKSGPQSWDELAETVKGVLSRLGPAAILAGIAATLPALGSIGLFYYMNELGTWLRGHGTQGVALYSAGFAVCVGLALLPTYASAALGGWAFGFASGFPAAMTGFVAGSLIGYAIARPAASARVEAVIGEKPQWRAVRDALVGSGFWRTLLIVTLVRVPPNSPFAVTNLVLASVRVPLVTYLLGTAVGMAPRTAVVLWVASRLQQQVAKEAVKQTPWWLIVAGIGLSVAVLGVLGWIGKRGLERATRGTGGGL